MDEITVPTKVDATEAPRRAARRPARAGGGEGLRYAPAVRLHEVRNLLNATGGATVYDIADRLEVSVRTAIRYLQALSAAGEPLYELRDGRRKVWRLMASARRDAIVLTRAQMTALFLSRRVFDFLAGTGFKEDLDDVFQRLEATLKRRDLEAARNLDKKIFDVNEAPHIYADRGDDVNDIVTALLSEEQLRLSHGGDGPRKRTLFDPYTLLVYKKGLYLVGYSHRHAGIRTLSLDDVRDVEWMRGARFEYPASYDPSQVAHGAFGLIRGPTTRVRIFFSEKVARFIRRRQWHPTQRIRRVEGGIELAMVLDGTRELVSWVLGWGAEAELIEPESLRDELMREAVRMAGRYRGKPKAPQKPAASSSSS
jgi:proteasome accessory factor B